MKKFVSIVLTTGLLMGTVAFGALACDQNGNCPDQFQNQKQMEQHESYQPPKGHKDQVAEKVVVTVIKAMCEPELEPASMVKPLAPRSEHSERDHKVMPQPVSNQHDHNRQPGSEQPGDPEQVRQ